MNKGHGVDTITKATKTNYSRWRAIALITVYALIGLHIAHWKITGRSLAPLELNEVAYTLHLGMITAGFIFMSAAIISTLIAGRFFCSWGCHLLAIQDLSAWLLSKVGIRPKPIRSRVLLWVPVLAMTNLFIFPLAMRLMEGNGWPDFHVVSDVRGWTSFISNNLWRNLPGPGITILTFVVCGFLMIYFLGSRSFCNYACPYGAIFSAADRLAPGRIVLTGDCTQCGLCTARCQSDIRVHDEIARFGMVVNPACLKDLDCVSVCDQQAIHFGFTMPPLFGKHARVKKYYSYSRFEDFVIGIVFLLCLFIVRGLYDTIPFLLAIALSILFACYFIFVYRLVKEKGLRFFNSIALKRTGRYTTAGKISLIMGLLILFFLLHSMFIRWHNYSGTRAYLLVKKYTEASIGGNISPNTFKSANEALIHFKKIDKWGLLTPPGINRQLASLYLLRRDYPQAVEHLQKTLLQSPDDVEARFRLGNTYHLWGKNDEASDVFRNLLSAYGALFSKRDTAIVVNASLQLGDILAAQKKYGTAFLSYSTAVSIDPGNAVLWLSYGSAMAKCGRLSQAKNFLMKSIEIDPGNAATHFNLGTVYALMGQTEDAVLQYRQSAQLNPKRAETFCNLGKLLYKQHKFDEAESTFGKALTLDPNSAIIHSYMAKMLDEKKGNFRSDKTIQQ